MSLTVRRGDTHPVYWRILDAAGVPIDLTGATAELHVKPTKPSGPAVTLIATVEPVEKRIRHDLTGTLAPGDYAYELEITKDGAIMTAPTRENGVLTVLPDLA